MRLIDADVLLDYLDEEAPQNWTGSEAEIQAMADWEQFKGIINFQPTITKVEDVVEAKWVAGDKMPNYPRIPYQFNRHYCSACELPAVAKEHDRYDIEEFLTPRCPECGAHMKNGG